ncbi:MAG: response regulator [Chthoniobacteraceae bacterium]
MSEAKDILLVEDSPQDAELTLDVLSKHNLANKVVHVRDGAEALDFLHCRGAFADRGDALPALVLLDLKMPKVDGLEVLRDIKGDPKLKVVPVVVMTSSREDADLHKCYELGVNAYVVKPVKFNEFVEAVRELSIFWILLNEPHPACRPRNGNSGK